eukprot:174532-Rhodomonas_salina.2
MVLRPGPEPPPPRLRRPTAVPGTALALLFLPNSQRTKRHWPCFLRLDVVLPSGCLGVRGIAT